MEVEEEAEVAAAVTMDAVRRIMKYHDHTADTSRSSIGTAAAKAAAVKERVASRRFTSL